MNAFEYLTECHLSFLLTPWPAGWCFEMKHLASQPPACWKSLARPPFSPPFPCSGGFYSSHRESRPTNFDAQRMDFTFLHWKLLCIDVTSSSKFSLRKRWALLKRWGALEFLCQVAVSVLHELLGSTEPQQQRATRQVTSWYSPPEGLNAVAQYVFFV